MKVSILGGGNAAYAQAFHCVQLGHEVLIHVSEPFKSEVQAIIDTGCVEAIQRCEKSVSPLYGVSKISKVTTSMKEAVEFSNVLLVTIPAFGQRPTFEAALPYLTKDHVIVNLPGNLVFLEVTEIVKEKTSLDVKKDLPFTIVECSSIPYACRKTGGNKVFIIGTKTSMYAGVYPSSRTEAALSLIAPLFSLKLNPVKNVIEAALNNLNYLLHTPITIYNAGWIQAKKGDFEFYKEGATSGILRLMAALDEERIKVAKAAGFDVPTMLTIGKTIYSDTKSESLDDFIMNATQYETIKAPPSLNTRLITEDMNYAFVPIFKYLGGKYNVKTPIADAIITSAKYLSGFSMEAARKFENFPRDLSEI